MIVGKLVLDLARYSVEKTIRVKQYDRETRQIVATLLNDGEPYVIPESSTVRIECQKPDGTEILNDCTYINNIVTAEVTEQMTSCAGFVECAISIFNLDSYIASWTFNLKVDATVITANGIASDNEYQSIIKKFNEIETTEQELSDAIEVGKSVIDTSNELLDKIEILEHLENMEEVEDMVEHMGESVPSEVGAHGFRYFEGKLQAHVYDEESMTLKWVTVPGSGIDYDGDKSVKGAIDECVRTLGYTKSYNSLNNTAITTTKNGLTFNVNSDKSVTVVGTPTADTYIVIDVYTEKQGQHILSGCPSGGSASGYRLYCYNVSTSITIETDLGEGVEFTLDEDLEIGVSILVKSGTVMNHTFYPMIRQSDIEDDTYVPYVPSVNEPQVIALKTGLNLIIQGKLAILKCEGYSYTHNEKIISDDKYKPNGQIYRSMMRTFTSDAKYYDGLVSVKNDGTITMSYLSSQGTGPSTNNIASGQLYGELIYLIN